MSARLISISCPRSRPTLPFANVEKFTRIANATISASASKLLESHRAEVLRNRVTIFAPQSEQYSEKMC